MENVLNQFGRQQAFKVAEHGDVAAVRRAGSDLARRQGWSEVRAGQLAIVITEAATNIIKHAEHGEILLRGLQQGEVHGIEIIALDTGPGISDLELRMQDGNSTAGTYGVGLGAIKRLTQEFDIYSGSDVGTAMMMVVWASDLLPQARDWEIGAVCLPMPGEDECGDGWCLEDDGGGMTLLLSDGLGHGPEAAKASRAATDTVAQYPALLPQQLMQRLHTALHGSRGAAIALAQIERDTSQLRFAGVGNIAACIMDMDGRRHLISHNGIVGSNLRKVQEFTVPWQAGATIIMHSDGLATRWNLDTYRGLSGRHPALTAAVLYRDFVRGRDDVTVLVLRQHPDQL